MAEFKRYPKVRRLGEADTQGIEAGTCVVFPKIDGTNASSWWDETKDEPLRGGSRNRELSLDNDNQGFYNWLVEQDHIRQFHQDHPEKILYGEWLVPHSLKTYRDEAWENFYVFDVMIGEEFLPYEQYKPLLEEYDIEYIPPLGIVKDGTKENFLHYVQKNDYLIEDGKGTGEGITVKNYDFVNKFGRQCFAKIVTSKFKEKLHKEQGPPEHTYDSVERKIVEEYVTEGRVEKVFQKIKQDGWRRERIPELFGRVYHDLITEEAWSFIKEHNNPTVNFGKMRQMVINQIKKHKPELF